MKKGRNISYLLNQVFNTGRFLFTYLSKRPEAPYPPVTLMVEPTNKCNIKCTMCFRDMLSRKKGLLSFDLYKKMVDQNHRIQRIVFCGSGEPLLHADLEGMIRYAADRHIPTRLHTNGTLLDGTRAEKIILSGIDSVVISFEGMYKEEYEKIRAGADYLKLEGNIQSFSRLKNTLNREKLSVSVDCIDFDYPIQEKNAFQSRMLSLGVNYVNFLTHHGWPGHHGKRIADQNYHCCILPWLMLTVLWDGRVAACCDDFDGMNVIGRLDEEVSIEKLFNSPQMYRLREKLSKKNINDIICGKCYRIHRNPWKYPFLNRINRELKEIFVK